MERCLAAFHEPFQSIVRATAPEDLRFDPVLVRPPLEAWGSGPVTLLGDAAHPILPHAGQGAAQALEDAVELGRALGAAESIHDALRSYEVRRIPRTRSVVALAARNARISSIRSGWGISIRDWAIRHVPESVILKSLIALGRPPS